MYRAELDLVNRGLATIGEKDIAVIIKSKHEQKKNHATSGFQSRGEESEISIICVGRRLPLRAISYLSYIYPHRRSHREALKEKDKFHVGGDPPDRAGGTK